MELFFYMTPVNIAIYIYIHNLIYLQAEPLQLTKGEFLVFLPISAPLLPDWIVSQVSYYCFVVTYSIYL